MSARDGSDVSHSPAPSSAELVLYSKPGCHLCDETRLLVGELLAGRAAAGLAVPPLTERNILTDPNWERDHFETIPVLEFAGDQLPLAIRPAQVRSFLDRVLAPARAV